MAQFSHVNLCMTGDLIEAETSFLVDVLGYKELNTGAMVSAGTRWLEFPDGSQVHLNAHESEKEFARGQALGHVALQIDDLEAFHELIQREGIRARAIESDGIPGFVVSDPAGNLWEIRAEYPFLGHRKR